PNTFLFDVSYRPSPVGYDWFYSRTLELTAENGAVYPHIIASIYQYHDDIQEDKIVYGELAALVDCMKRRANQIKIDDLEELKNLSRQDEESDTELDLSKYLNQYQFPAETRSPVLLLSYVRPQHARIFYACMDAPQL
ncbi:hypothetical protein BO71DRAFT_470221, partial [Aspergillus ellipticus CBS 707.79]